MKKLRNISLLVAVAFIYSCSFTTFKKSAKATPQEVFDYLWNDVKERYVYFEYKNIDWDSVRRVYEPKISADMEEEELFYVLSDMLGTFDDGHVNLLYKMDRSRSWDWMYDYPINYNRDVLIRNYLGKDFKSVRPFIYDMIDSIGYIYYGSFSPSMSSSTLDTIINYFDANGAKGLIFDIRHNGGGQLSNVFKVANRLADTTRAVHHLIYKDGPGANDYADTIHFEVKPKKGKSYDKPVALLTNRSCYSGATFLASFLNHLPHVTQIGDSTGGGGGVVLHYELPNGWLYRLSSTISLDAKNKFNMSKKLMWIMQLS